MKTYIITQQVGFFDELNVLVTATAALGIAVELHVSGHVDHAPGDYLSIECKHLNDRVRLPLVGPVPMAIAGRIPDAIEVTVMPGRDRERDYSHWTAGFRTLLDALYQPFVVNYYERTVDRVRAKYGTDRTSWPDAWQMGWMVRNGVSHGGQVHFRHANQQGVTWKGLNITPNEQGTQILDGLVNVGDLMLLLIDMEESLAGPLQTKSDATGQ